MAFAVRVRRESLALFNVFACASAAAFLAASAFLAAAISSTVGFLVAASTGEIASEKIDIEATNATRCLRDRRNLQITGKEGSKDKSC